MKVFASNYLEKPMGENITKGKKWSWEPSNPDAEKIYASGNSTSSSESTYAAERDSRTDHDRPNEGMLIA